MACGEPSPRSHVTLVYASPGVLAPPRVTGSPSSTVTSAPASATASATCTACSAVAVSPALSVTVNLTT